jgi:23S rRNA (adenine-N6)-dimethyltransferase
VSGRRAWRSGHSRSQHFLAGRRLAGELVQGADLRRDDLVLEFGAGYGRLTAELASCAGHVIAVELDHDLATRLRARFADSRGVTVVEQDALLVPLPRSPFKVVANPPFHLTAALLHRLLDDPRLPLQRAELVLGWGAALSLATVHPPSRRSMRWQPWYEILLVRRIASSSFQPAPTRDAAIVSIRRRAQPLLPAKEAPRFREWARRQDELLDVWQLAAGYAGGAMWKTRR